MVKGVKSKNFPDVNNCQANTNDIMALNPDRYVSQGRTNIKIIDTRMHGKFK